jgi:hypothetical protein
MKKILKSPTCLSMLIGVIIAFVTCITFIFIKSTTYFTIGLLINIITNFAVIGYNMIRYDKKESTGFKSLMQAAYSGITVFLVIMDLQIAYWVWDLTIYSNVMYLTNTQMYVVFYAIFVIAMLLMHVYAAIKEKVYRQKSTKVSLNDKKEDE